MPYKQAKQVDAEYFALEVYLSWAAVCEEFTKPEEIARLLKAKWHKGELVFDELKEEFNIPRGADAYTVAKAVGDYFGRVGYAKFKFLKVSDNQVLYDRADMVTMPAVRKARTLGWKIIAPEPSHSLFVGALKKAAKSKPEIISIPPPEWLKSGEPVPDDMGREMWRISPL
ncbi:MAG: hypothetical protein HYY41_04850 [Chloroflexi bacterium]|nr:hypothetical protein [Chloroflexota bacterium]MBI2980140.1 hypothetical protein [Chloroflexota bacterium]